MSKSGTRVFQDFGGALGLLSVIPVPRQGWVGEGWQAGRALVWFPAVGWLIGGLAFGAWWLCSRVFPPMAAAALTLTVWVALTGGLHLDGLIDSSDGLLATVTPERRLEIMKDPRAGSFGVISAVLLLIVKFAALVSLSEPLAVLIIPSIARALMLLPMMLFSSARSSGLGNAYRQGARRVWLAALWLLPALLLTPRAVIWLIGGAAVVLLFSAWAARRLNGGLTGDVYGAACELAEAACLILATLS